MNRFVHKGIFYYEMVLLMFVIMWQHDMSYKPVLTSTSGLKIGRLHIWINRYWWFATSTRIKIDIRSFFLPSTMFFKEVFSHVHQYNTISGKLGIIRINIIKMMSNSSLVRNVISLANYLALNSDGFIISESSMGDDCIIYRFWWKDTLIRDMPDINCTFGRYTTRINGSVKYLGWRKKK